METAAPKQRSPWLYVALGCGGAALLSCLGLAAVFGFGAFKLKDSLAGMNDPAKANEQAVKLLGTVPAGYSAQGSMNMFGLMEMVQLAKGEVMEDGGMAEVERLFVFIVTTANETNAKQKAYFKGESNSDDAPMRATDVLKRGNFTIEGLKTYYVVSRGELNMGNAKTTTGGTGPKLNAAILFDCPGDKLHVGVWSMPDPMPEVPSKSVKLEGTVGDEAELVPFLKQLSPCGT